LRKRHPDAAVTGLEFGRGFEVCLGGTEVAALEREEAGPKGFFESGRRRKQQEEDKSHGIFPLYIV
jgi:hypothetical protein